MERQSEKQFREEMAKFWEKSFPALFKVDGVDNRTSAGCRRSGAEDRRRSEFLNFAFRT